MSTPKAREQSRPRKLLTREERAIRRVVRETGHHPELRRIEYGRFVYRAVCCCGDRPVTVEASDTCRFAALGRIRRRIYELHRRLIFELAGGNCAECGEAGPLECDHIVPCSHGRNDRIENLRALCRRCHGLRHGNLAVEVIAGA
jgi:5-methylcytosine-specific restriction endonuclease McrA